MLTTLPETSDVVARSLEEYLYVHELSKNGRRMSYPPPKVESPYKNFEFLKDTEDECIPVHEIERHRETYRRGAWNTEDISVTRHEFVDITKVDREMVKDPLDEISVLDVSSGMRAYFGDPVEESYEALKRVLMPVNEDLDWVKKRHFLKDGVAMDFARLKWKEARSALNVIKMKKEPNSPTEGTSEDLPAAEEEEKKDESKSRRFSNKPPFSRASHLEAIFPPEERCPQIRPITRAKERFFSECARKKAFAGLIQATRLGEN